MELEAKIFEIKEEVKNADYVLVGIGEEFQVDYQYMREIFEYNRVLIETEKEENQWAQSFLIHHFLRHGAFTAQRMAYEALADLLEGKDYFVVSTCTDDVIRQSPLDQSRLVTPCGTFYKMQCENNCGADVEYGEKVASFVAEEVLHRYKELNQIERPLCEKCGGHYVMNTIFEEKYDESGYQPEWQNYSGWLQKTVNRKLVILELGVGMTYPSVIRFPFEKTSFFNKKSRFYRINENVYQLSEQSEQRGAGIKANVFEFLEKI